MDWEVGRQMVRSIAVVEDLDAFHPDQRFCKTASLLGLLSAPMLSMFRREVRNRYKSEKPRLLCGKCRKPVYVSLSGASPGERRDGRDAFFAHHAGTAEDCEWGTSGENPRDIDRLKFGGSTEGLRHRHLKALLASMLKADAAFDAVLVEDVISRPPEWRKPDVYARFLDRLIAFDLQLATTQLPTIVDREGFYERHGIRYVWVTSTNDAGNLARQAFQDIYWNNEGQIFGIDERAQIQTLESGELHLWSLTVAPRLDARGLRSVWEQRLVGRKDVEWNTESGRPRFLGIKFNAAVRDLTKHFADPKLRLVKAVGRSAETAHVCAERAWDEIAREVGAGLWSSAKQDRVFKAIGVLATAAAGKKMDASGHKNLAAVFNDLLEHNRGWTSALVQIAKAYEQEDLLSVPSTRRKTTRNLTEGHPDLQHRYAAMLDVIFPKSALSRLTGPPTEIEEVLGCQISG